MKHSSWKTRFLFTALFFSATLLTGKPTKLGISDEETDDAFKTASENFVKITAGTFMMGADSGIGRDDDTAFFIGVVIFVAVFLAKNIIQNFNTFFLLKSLSF